jgi:hypothetical protein
MVGGAAEKAAVLRQAIIDSRLTVPIIRVVLLGHALIRKLHYAAGMLSST